MPKDLYAQIKKELDFLRACFKKSHTVLLPSQEQAIRKKISIIYREAQQIGGGFLEDAQQFKEDVEQFLQGDLPEVGMIRLLEHALKLEQGTREL